jgi:hypothetical protein
MNFSPQEKRAEELMWSFAVIAPLARIRVSAF